MRSSPPVPPDEFGDIIPAERSLKSHVAFGLRFRYGCTLSAVSEAPRTRYAKSGDVHIAYQVLGDGPTDVLLLVADFIPTDAWEEQPRLAHDNRGEGGISMMTAAMLVALGQPQ